MLLTFRSFFGIGILLIAVGVSAVSAQEQKNGQDQPQVRVNYLNVCTPSDAEQQEIRASLGRIPAPKFTPDFEISRGHSTMENAPPANWVRVRREFGSSTPFIAAQYSISVDEKSIIETLVFRSREAKDVLQVQLEDDVTGAPSARTVLDTDTPVNRIKLERFGKSSVVLAQCPTADQRQYQPLFDRASQVLSDYRAAMRLKHVVPRELEVLGALPHTAKPAAAKRKK